MALVYPIQWEVAIRGAHGSYRAPARCSALSGFCLQFANDFFGILPRRKKISKTRHEMLQFVNFRENEKKKQLLTTLRDQLGCKFDFFFTFFFAFFVAVNDRCCHMGTGCPVDGIRVAGGPPADPAEG